MKNHSKLFSQVSMLLVVSLFIACNSSNTDHKTADRVDSNLQSKKSANSTPPPPTKGDSLSVFENFVPSGWMGDGEDQQRTYVQFDETYKNNPHSSGSCAKVTYARRGSKGWAGIYWQNVPDNWCKSPGEDFSQNKFTRITFWARGEQGGELVEFKAGGIKNCIKGGAFGDSFETRTKRITLEKNWTEYTIDLTGEDLKSVIGGFCWSAPAPKSPMTFYIDDVYYR